MPDVIAAERIGPGDWTLCIVTVCASWPTEDEGPGLRDPINADPAGTPSELGDGYPDEPVERVGEPSDVGEPRLEDKPLGLLPVGGWRGAVLVVM